MVIRGVGSDGQPLRLKRDNVKHGIRGIAEDICTRQLGYRTSRDATEAERREIGESRFYIARSRDPARSAKERRGTGFVLSHYCEAASPSGLERGSAPPSESCGCPSRGFETNGTSRVNGTAYLACEVWRRRSPSSHAAGQRSPEDAHGACVPMSDERLPIEMLYMRQLTAV
jgi:hypothetical protein